MSYSVFVDTALQLPPPDVEALIEGRVIAAMPRIFLEPGRSFALYPANISINLLPHEQYYRSSFLPIAKTSFSQLTSETILIKAWAKCELCQILNDPESLEVLSQLTVWTTEALQQTLLEKPYIFLAYLRVYLLPQPLEIPVHPSGNFVSLPKSLTVTDSTPVLSESIFAKRRQQLEKLEPPEHPELEELQSALVHLSTTNPKAKQLDAELKMFLGWSKKSPTTQPDPDLGWIQTISQVGNSSDGDGFEKLVRKGFIKLGFGNSNSNPKASLDPESTGGAGGLDFYCETPYQVVGECKATKSESVADGTPAQLIKLGHKHLQEQYNCCIKIIMAAGQLNTHAQKVASGNHMNVIRPETLQRLVELKAKHPGSINLLDLKPCLEQEPFGEDADVKVNRYIERVWDKIKVRSQIVQAVKQLCYSDSEFPTVVEIKVQYNAKFATNFKLTYQSVSDLTIELSSPLTGYLGRREKGNDAEGDRFYFLRDLLLDD